MFEPGQEINVDAESGKRRFLTLFRVEEAADQLLTLRATEHDAATPGQGQTVMLCFHKGASFMRIDARVASFVGGAIQFALLTEAKACESREAFRVSVEGAGFIATVNDRSKCEIIDVSPDGLGILSKDRRFADEGVPVELEIDGKTYKGPCVVRNVRQTPLGWRAGLELMKSAKASTLRTGLQKLTMQGQRLRLKREHDEQSQAA